MKEATRTTIWFLVLPPVVPALVGSGYVWVMGRMPDGVWEALLRCGIIYLGLMLGSCIDGLFDRERFRERLVVTGIMFVVWTATGWAAMEAEGYGRAEAWSFALKVMVPGTLVLLWMQWVRFRVHAWEERLAAAEARSGT